LNAVIVKLYIDNNSPMSKIHLIKYSLVH